ncbi:MAG: hypothetical protein ACK5U8_00425 [Deltaproteobacteria bacterium]|nr:hypothetical protein [Deltaproteobacteria bacterium]
MDTLLVRLKPFDPRRGQVLRRYTYAGIKFQEERGWYRVEKPVAEYLRGVRETPTDRYSPLAFDVCTEAEAKALETTETEASKVKRSATDDLKVVPARPAGALTSDDLPKPATAPAKDDEKDARRGKRERE